MHNFNDEMEAVKWKLYKSGTIADNHARLVEASAQIHSNLVEYLALPEGDKTTTWRHDKYNFWTHSMLVDPIFFAVWEDLVRIIKDNSPKDARGAWVQSWLNYDSHDSVESNLKHHAHSCPLHGYVSISPQNTKTVFDEWEVPNEVGTIYIGLGKWMHHVENLGEYSGPRITIGYDVIYGDQPGEGWNEEDGYQSFPWHEHWIPIILND